MDQNEDLGGALAGRYEIVREVGRGGMAVVYLAHDIKHNRPVALKVLLPELATSLGPERFLSEIAITASLVHQNILALYDSGEAAGFLYYVMPYVDGPTLGQRLKREVQLPLDDVLAIARQVAAALDYAHAQGVIHRDIKPDNILLRGEHVLVGDFGLARAISSAASTPLTDGRFVVGTVPYMSPEQCTPGRAVDGRSDIYSLGCVVFEMIAGVPPFRGATADATMSHHLTSEPPSLRTERRSCPSSLDDVVRRALAKTPADRFRTAGEFVRALESARAIVMPPPVAPQRSFSRWTALGLVVGGAAALLLWLASIKTRDPPRGTPRPDTTRVALLPVEHPNLPAGPEDDLLYDAFARWRDVDVVDPYRITGALKARAIVSNDDARSIAVGLGAGRYVLGRMTRVGDSLRLSLGLYDVLREEPLYGAVQYVGSKRADVTVAYQLLADSLLLRGRAIDYAPVVRGERSLSAVQAFGAAQDALGSWDLMRAESGLETSLNSEPNYSRAHLWLAQVRVWRRVSVKNWQSSAARAATAPDLSQRERSLAKALVHLANGEYSRACAEYETLRLQNDQEFAAWYGLGQCRSMDKRVVRDTASLSDWRFRASYQQAVLAYTRALELMPSVHLGLQLSGPNPLDILEALFPISYERLYSGVSSGPDSIRFLARPSLQGDTVALIPFPWEQVTSGTVSTTPAGFDRAIEHHRALVHRIVLGWARALPTSPAVKHALAITMELVGDRAAVDTLRSARALSSDSGRRIQLAAAEVFTLVRFATPDDLSALRTASLLADSLLSRGTDVPARDAGTLAPLAELTGRCRVAEVLNRRALAQGPDVVMAGHLAGEMRALLGAAAMGCKSATSAAFAALAARVRRASGPMSKQRRFDEHSMLAGIASMLMPYDSSTLLRFGDVGDDSFFRALTARLRGDTLKARAILVDVMRDRGSSPATPDAILGEARLWLSMADTAAAVRSLESTRASVDRHPHYILSRFARGASLVRALALRADIADAQHDVVTARRWRRAVATLSENADDELRSHLRTASK